MTEILSRKEAKLQNLKHYFTGKVCGNNHISNRLVSTGNCLECAKTYAKNYSLKHPETRQASQEKWRTNNVSKIKAWKAENAETVRRITRKSATKHADKYKRQSKIYRLKNAEKINAYHRQHYLDFPEKYFANNAKRRAAKIRATVKWADLEKINQFYSKKPDGFHVDHIIPLKHKLVCGLHNEFNLQYLPEKDNLAKSNKFEPLFIQPEFPD